MTIIRLDSVTKFYGQIKIIDDISLKIKLGERLIILGPSGCGKTTILRLIAGLIAPDEGKIVIEGELASENGQILLPPEQRNLGMVFQDLALWPHFSVAGNIEFGLKAIGMPLRERKIRIMDTLKLVGLEGFAERKPGELSGGQQQRVALARALASRPGALLMDEPLSSLDPELNIRLRKEVLRLHEKSGFTLLYVTHDREEAWALSNRMILMRKGRIEIDGSVEEARDYFNRDLLER
ncbi:MAG: ABC transporter ATP-binding protein [FCB group bacterium]|nr:ABC transporter ATP-binding protein [FCB group bacterium]